MNPTDWFIAIFFTFLLPINFAIQETSLQDSKGLKGMDSTSIHFPASSFAIAIAQRKQQQQKQLQQHKKNDNFFLIKNGPTLTFSIKFLWYFVWLFDELPYSSRSTALSVFTTSNRKWAKFVPVFVFFETFTSWYLSSYSSYGVQPVPSQPEVKTHKRPQCTLVRIRKLW